MYIFNKIINDDDDFLEYCGFLEYEKQRKNSSFHANEEEYEYGDDEEWLLED